jgi:phenylpropionate dioxygenase-like ring-hydroxylating dioxygenase large terminal subunit
MPKADETGDHPGCSVVVVVGGTVVVVVVTCRAGADAGGWRLCVEWVDLPATEVPAQLARSVQAASPTVTGPTNAPGRLRLRLTDDRAAGPTITQPSIRFVPSQSASPRALGDGRTMVQSKDSTPGIDDPFTAPLPAAAYVDSRRHEAERAAIFAREWVALGDAARLARPGDYLAVTVAGYPLVVVNDEGDLRGFRNLCRHRSGPLVWDGEGRSPSFVCRYHGWAYGLDGALRSARDFGEEVPVEECSLHPISVAQWRSLLFACVDATAPPLLQWLGPIVEHCRPFAMEEFVATERSSHELAANWKVYAENYQEGYHIPLVHPGLNRQVDASRYEVDVVGEACLHSAPTRDGSATSGAWWWRFPGLALNLYTHGMSLESFWPTGPEATRLEYTFFFAPGTAAAEVERAVASSVGILEEDRRICEAVQRNLASGLAGPARLSPRHEGGVALLQGLVERALAERCPVVHEGSSVVGGRDR